MKVKHILGLWLFTLILLALSCKDNTGTKIEKKVAIPVKTARVAQKTIREYHTFNGTTQYLKKENIRSSVTGYISWMPFKIGAVIRKHETFAAVRTKEQDAMAEAVKIDSSLAAFSNPLKIYANSTGVITALNFYRNDFVAEGDVVATIVQPQSLVVQVNVPFEDTKSTHVGTSCTIFLPDKSSVTAKISNTLPRIDPLSQSQAFLIEMPNRRLPENLNVQVKTTVKESPKALTVPHEALQTNELLTEFWVMKVVNDTLAIKEKVTPLLRNDSLI